MSLPRTMLDKLWQSHTVAQRADGATLLWVDRHLVHEGSHHAFARIAGRELPVAEPGLTYAVVDHYAPTRGEAAGAAKDMITRLQKNTKAHGISLFDRRDPRQGIVHVIGPEQGLTLPGLSVVCGDSHTSTHGAFGCLAFGIGATDVAHVLATQCVWSAKPKLLRIRFSGHLSPGVTAKDMALAWIARLGADGARGHAVEYCGPAVEALSMEGRMTLCNLSIEGGARFGLIAPDATTFGYLKSRPYAPSGAVWDSAVAEWRALVSDPEAKPDAETELDASAIEPTVTWGTAPDQAVPIGHPVPRPEETDHPDATRDALSYMALASGKPIRGTPIDRVFIGSCTNGRLEDLRSAAAVLRGRSSAVPGIVSPGSVIVKQRAEDEGLHEVFLAAGLEWVAPGCSMCVGMNGDIAEPGERVASSTNRNFRGRQGKGVRTHLMSPAMVAAAAVSGRISDVREFLAASCSAKARLRA